MRTAVELMAMVGVALSSPPDIEGIEGLLSVQELESALMPHISATLSSVSSGFARDVLGRRLQHTLTGDVEELESWTCANRCKPPHEREDVTPGTTTEDTVVDPYAHCRESVATSGLSRRVDFDYKCMGHNISCDGLSDEQKTTLLNQPDELFTECDQDPDLLYGSCWLVCRFGTYLTHRCHYAYDRRNKYGMLDGKDHYSFHHCHVVAECSATSTDELQSIHCNKTGQGDLDSAPKAASGCLYEVNATWSPELAGHEHTWESSGDECQHRCATTVGCEKFGWNVNTQDCYLYGATATKVLTDAWTVGGPRTCDVVETTFTINNLNYDSLMGSPTVRTGVEDAIKRSIHERTRAPEESIMLSLAAGSVVATAKFNVPEAVTRAQAEEGINSGLAELVTTTVLAVNDISTVTSGTVSVSSVTIADPPSPTPAPVPRSRPNKDDDEKDDKEGKGGKVKFIVIGAVAMCCICGLAGGGLRYKTRVKKTPEPPPAGDFQAAAAAVEGNAAAGDTVVVGRPVGADAAATQEAKAVAGAVAAADEQDAEKGAAL